MIGVTDSEWCPCGTLQTVHHIIIKTLDPATRVLPTLYCNWSPSCHRWRPLLATIKRTMTTKVHVANMLHAHKFQRRQPLTDCPAVCLSRVYKILFKKLAATNNLLSWLFVNISSFLLLQGINLLYTDVQDCTFSHYRYVYSARHQQPSNPSIMS